MFESLKNKVSKSKARVRKGGIEIPTTVRFLQALANNKLRLTYAALADAAEALGEHEATNMSAGQRGARLLSGLPIELQPFVCRGNGSYAKGTEWEGLEVSIKQLKTMDYIRPESIGDYVAAFQAHEASDEESPADEASDEEIIEDSDEE